MAFLLFVKPQEVMTDTIIGGNVDIDKIKPIIKDVQTETIEELLGTELYDKIVTDIESDSLTGLYLKMFEDFVVPITTKQSAASYILISPYVVGNGGFFKNTYNGVESTNTSEVERISQIYSSKAQTDIIRFQKWIDKNPLPEYKTYQDEVNASKNINLNNGWYFGDK